MKSRKMFLAHIELTNACNFRCLHCYADKYGNEYIDEAKLKNVLRTLHEHGVDVVTFLGGEPLLAYQQLVTGIKYARRLGMAVRLFTNGSLIPSKPQIIEIFKKYNTFVVLSLYAGSRDGYLRFTRCDGYDSVVKALEMFSRSGVNFQVNIVLTKKNEEEFEKIIDLIKRLKIRWVWLWHYAKEDRCRSLKVDEIFLPPEKLLEYSKKLASAINIEEPSDVYYYLPRNEILEKCFAGEEGIVVTADLDVYPCVFTVYPFFKLGNLRRDDLETILERGKALEKKIAKPFCWNLNQVPELYAYDQ